MHVCSPPRSENRCCSQGCHWEGTGNIVPCPVMRGPAKFLYGIGYSFGLGTKGPSHKILNFTALVVFPQFDPCHTLFKQANTQTRNNRTHPFLMFSEHFCVSKKKMFWCHCLALPSHFVFRLLTSQHLWPTPSMCTEGAGR